MVELGRSDCYVMRNSLQRVTGKASSCAEAIIIPCRSLEEHNNSRSVSLSVRAEDNSISVPLVSPTVPQSVNNHNIICSPSSHYTAVMFSDGRNNGEIMGECQRTSYVNHG